jgi:hypothetical protein
MEDEKGIQWKVKHWHQLALHFPQWFFYKRVKIFHLQFIGFQ